MTAVSFWAWMVTLTSLVVPSDVIALKLSVNVAEPCSAFTAALSSSSV